ncbi:MAG: NifB/NifX family molybdenum-iron cluster-binding protein [Candidatus Gracilibacteria bacterium]
MKTIIASLKEGENYEIAENAARAPYFVVLNGEEYEKTIKNPFTHGGGAGFAVAELLKDEGCEKFIAGKIGGNMKGQLDEFKITYEEK